MTNPILVEVTRGDHLESTHRGAYCIIDADGAAVASAGDVERPVFPRSAVKPFQALPFVESGAFDAFGADPADLALACGSHSGEPTHVARAAGMLDRIGAHADDLVCAGHWPFHEASMHDLVCSGQRPGRCHNNCSGKHAAFLATARHLSIDLAGYHRPDHSIQSNVTAALSASSGFRVDGMSGIDGCGIPAHAAPLQALALAFARLGADRLPTASQNAAARRIRQAVASAPHMVAGTGRFDTRVMSALGARVLVKAGAEGVHCAAIPEYGVGIAVKIDDGAARAAEVLMAQLLHTTLAPTGSESDALRPLIEPNVTSWDGAPVGVIRARVPPHLMERT